MEILSPDLPPAFAPDSVAPEIAERVFAPACELNTWQFAQRHITLSEKASPTNPGPYDPDIAPHTKFFQEQLDNPLVHQITIKKSSQSGFTQSVLNKIVKCVAVEPVNILYTIDSLNEIKRVAHDRLKPMLEMCPLSAQVIKDDEDAELQTLTFYLRDMSVYLSGGGSIGAVANKSIGLGIVDEADKIPRMTGNHGHVVDEVKSRFKTIENFKLVVMSAPNEEIDITTTEYRKGSQHKFHVPCPHCGEFQLMVPERVVFGHCKRPDGDYDRERVKAEAHYSCIRAGTPECPDGRIFDHHKRGMALRGEWRPTNTNAEPGHVSIECTDLYSLFPGARFGLIALDIIDSQHNPAKKKAVWRDRFGQEWKTQRAVITNEQIRALRGTYLRGTLPKDIGRQFVIPLASDVQGDVRKWVRGAFNRKDELFIVDYGASLAYDDLLIEADVPVKHPETGEEYRTPEGMIDEGFETKNVRAFCIRAAAAGRPFYPAKGRGNVQTRGALVSASPVAQDGTEFEAYHFNDDEFKRGFYLDRIRDLNKIITGVSKVPRLWLPADCEAEFMAELCGEHLVPVPNPYGFTRYVWEKKSTNDWGDAIKLLYVWWFIAGPAYKETWQAEEKAKAA
ncbi:MAG TPA: terminase gpA endonuclease subunit [Lacunisphaera sp.]|nr:terminase gpA endonuclease subunit [Lacunisphaera sp.]